MILNKQEIRNIYLTKLCEDCKDEFKIIENLIKEEALKWEQNLYYEFSDNISEIRKRNIRQYLYEISWYEVDKNPLWITIERRN